jgi:integrase
MRLTGATITGLEIPPDKTERLVFDDAIPGFGIRLRAGDKRTWIFQYRIGPKQRRMSLGLVKVVPAGRARNTAADLHARVRLGQDPAMDKHKARAAAAETFGALAEKYLDDCHKRLRPRSYNEVERHLLKHAKSLHRLPITAVTHRGVADLLDTIDGNVTYNRVRADLCAFLSWALRKGIKLPEGNVASLTDQRDEKSRERVLSAAELKTIWKACRDNDYGAVLKLLILTGQRANEIAGLRWDEVYDEQIVLPAERTKNKRSHIIPLSEPAKAILAQLPRQDRTYVFGRDDTGFQGWSAAKNKLDTGPLPHWTPHDLRRTAATGMAELGVQPHIIEAVLNHASGHKGGIAGIYNRATYDREKREALERWAQHVLAIVGAAPCH